MDSNLFTHKLTMDSHIKPPERCLYGFHKTNRMKEGKRHEVRKSDLGCSKAWSGGSIALSISISLHDLFSSCSL